MNRSSALKYLETADYIRARIDDGVYKTGEVIPGQRELSDQLEVSRLTVRRAISHLEQEGSVECVPSVGTLVKDKSAQKALVGYLVGNLQDPFHLEAIRILDRALNHRNAALIVAEGSNADRLVKMGVERIIKSGRFADTVSKDTVTTVYIGREMKTGHSVSFDNNKGMSLVYAHLSDLHHRRIAYVSNIEKEHDLRFQCLLKEMTDVERRCTSDNSFFIDRCSEENCLAVLDDILKSDAEPTAIVCENDWVAMMLLKSTRERGIAVPGKISITGFDDNFMSSHMSTTLTTVGFSFEDTVERVLGILFNRNLSEFASETIDVHLITRRSTGTAPAPNQ